MRILFSILLTFFFTSLIGQPLSVINLVCEYQNNPIGIDVSTPRFSWQLTSTKNNVIQTAYEIRVATTESDLLKNQKLIWESGKVQSEQSVHVAYVGPALKSRQRYYWQLRVTDNQKNTSRWSEVKFWEMGLLNPSDWSAQWIESGLPDDSVNGPVPMFRKSFNLKKEIKTARAYITAKGLYEAIINGSKIGNAYLTPGWTSYKNRIQYQVYDVTRLVKTGDNIAGALIGNGWYRGTLALENHNNIYGNKTALLFQLEVTYVDGSKEVIISDSSWKTRMGPIRSSEIYNGEIYDARKETAGWMKTNFNDTEWKPVMIHNDTKDKLIATYGPLVKKHETFKPIKIFTTPKGEVVADFGQNLVGMLQIVLQGKAGDTVTIEHAEVLDKDGNFYIENLRRAKQRIQYVIMGGAPEVYEPHFTFMGFRYIRIKGYPGELKAENLTATALYSDMPMTGDFMCSNPLINQLQHNIQWGQKGNFLDVPTDCPQRDERLGWTGDAQVFARTAAFNMNVASFFSKWMKDVALDQRKDGAVPYIVPHVLRDKEMASAGWADVVTIVPWTMYQAYGDKKILVDQYESMKKWVSYMENNSKDYLWNVTTFQFGDWLSFKPFDGNEDYTAATDKQLIAQAFFIHSTNLLINIAMVLEKKDDIKFYSDLLTNIKNAFIKEYVTPNGRLISSTQTAYVLALNFDILPENMRKSAAERLVKNVKRFGNHLTTGFLGTPYLCHVLTRFGYTDVAYSLLLQEDYPSWLYPVKMGATTIWERWDGIKPDGSFQTITMNSFNHYAYGAIGDWMYRVVTGIQEGSPGYKKILIAPQPGGNLTNANAKLQTLYGEIKSSWKIEGNMMKIDVVIPPNTTAEVVLPKAPEASTNPSVTISEADENKKILLGSGKYHFQYNWK